VNKKYAGIVGLDKFWGKYAREGSIKDFSYTLADMPWYQPLAGRQFGKRNLECHSDKSHPKFFLRVSVTVANLKKVDDCLSSYANQSDYMFIIHHPTKRAGGGGHDGNLIPWTNAYVASTARVVHELTPRHFSPALMPIPRGDPKSKCLTQPVFIVQGDIERRNLQELEWMLSTPEEFIIRIMTRSRPDSINWTDARVQWELDRPMVEFHEAFQSASYMLPLISPQSRKTFTYFHGRSTSSIAYGAHFGLGFLAHRSVSRAFKPEFDNEPTLKHYWHCCDELSFLMAFRYLGCYLSILSF
jgi:hypothetical protein